MRKTKWRPGGRRKRPRNRRVMRKATEGGQEQKRVPPANCQTLVMKDGTIRSEAAFAGAMTRLSKPIETVGSPSPITPLTKPAMRKVRVATMRGRCSTGTSDCETKSTALGVEHFSLPIAEKCSRINTAARTEHTGRDTTGSRERRACHSLGGAKRA